MRVGPQCVRRRLAIEALAEKRLRRRDRDPRSAHDGPAHPAGRRHNPLRPESDPVHRSKVSRGPDDPTAGSQTRRRPEPDSRSSAGVEASSAIAATAHNVGSLPDGRPRLGTDEGPGSSRFRRQRPPREPSATRRRRHARLPAYDYDPADGQDACWTVANASPASRACQAVKSAHSSTIWSKGMPSSASAR